MFITIDFNAYNQPARAAVCAHFTGEKTEAEAKPRGNVTEQQWLHRDLSLSLLEACALHWMGWGAAPWTCRPAHLLPSSGSPNLWGLGV